MSRINPYLGRTGAAGSSRGGTSFVARGGYEPVGWSKCGSCGFRERCWTRAEESHDVALLSTVSQGLARELAARGVRSVDELLSSFDEGSLAVVRYGDGRRRRRVGGSAGPILRSARVLSRGKEELILMARADLPDPEDCVLFDLEGMPAHLDDLEKIYLWGLKVVANGSSRYLHSAADFGPEGDRQAWEGFLRNAAGLLDDRPTRRFIHWGSYEKSRIENPSVIPSEILVSSRAKRGIP